MMAGPSPGLCVRITQSYLHEYVYAPAHVCVHVRACLNVGACICAFGHVFSRRQPSVHVFLNHRIIVHPGRA